MTAAEREQLTPLQMAQNSAAAVLRLADYQASDPVQAYIDRAGTQGQHSAETAGNMALVSIAESLDRIANRLDRVFPL